MILRPEATFFTPEEAARYKELGRLFDLYVEDMPAFLSEIGVEPAEESPSKMAKLAMYGVLPLWDESDGIEEAVRARYILSFKGDKESIVNAAKEILAAVDQKDFKDITRQQRQAFEETKKKITEPYIKERLEKDIQRCSETYTNARRFLEPLVFLHYEALKQANLSTEVLDALVEAKIKEWGYDVKDDPNYDFSKGEIRAEEPDADIDFIKTPMLDNRLLPAAVMKKYLPMIHGKGTDILLRMIKQKPESITGSGRATIRFNDTTLTLENYKKLSGPLSISTDKLLRAALIQFTNNNHIGNGGRALKERTVHIPFSDYAYLCGYEVYPRSDETKEEAAKRTKNQKDNARKKIMKDLDVLYSGSIEWTENIKGKPKSFLSTRLLTQKGIIKDNTIIITFSPEFADYLIHRPIMQYPAALLSIDERNPNAYSMGLKIADYHSNDTNYRNGRNNRLKVKTLLAVTTLPDIETVKQQRNSWTRYIKAPFENALNALIDQNLLLCWAYKDTDTFKDFHDWEEALIQFELKDPPDPEDRLQRNKAIIEERATKKEAAAQKGNASPK